HLEVCCELAGILVQVLESGEITTARCRYQHQTGCNCEYVQSILHNALCERIHCGVADVLPATCHLRNALSHSGYGDVSGDLDASRHRCTPAGPRPRRPLLRYRPGRSARQPAVAPADRFTTSCLATRSPLRFGEWLRRSAPRT